MQDFAPNDNLHSDKIKLRSFPTSLYFAGEARRYTNFTYELGFCIDNYHVTSYNWHVIKTFADKQTQEFYITGKSKRFPPDVARRASRKLEYVDLASRIDDLKVPPGNLLHRLGRNRKGQFAIRINDQWRICFRFVDGDAYDVEITDYH